MVFTNSTGEIEGMGQRRTDLGWVGSSWSSLQQEFFCQGLNYREMKSRFSLKKNSKVSVLVQKKI